MENQRKPTVSVIILNYEKDQLLRKRQAEIIFNVPQEEDVEFVLVDNGSRNKAVFTVCKSAATLLPNGKAIRLEENQGFGGGFNKGVQYSTGEWIVLLSNDVEILGNFLPQLRSAIWTQQRALFCHRLMDWDTGWNNFNGTIITYPEGYFICTSRAIWDELKGFDPLFLPYDFEDVDLGAKCLDKEIPMLELNRLPIRHTPAGTIGYNSARMENTVAQRAKFAQKWGLENIPERP